MRTSTKLKKIDKFLAKHRSIKIKKQIIDICLECSQLDFIKINGKLYLSKIWEEGEGVKKEWINKEVYIPLDLILKIPSRYEVSIKKEVLTDRVRFYFWLNDDELYFFETRKEDIADNFIDKESIINFISILNNCYGKIIGDYIY